MTGGFATAFTTLKPAFASVAPYLAVKSDTAREYVLVSKLPSPFPQHKGHPLDFGSVRVGKAYVSVHLMALYMCPELNASISPALKKRMQGKSCFNFKNEPDAKLIEELKELAEAARALWTAKQWI